MYKLRWNETSKEEKEFCRKLFRNNLRQFERINKIKPSLCMCRTYWKFARQDANTLFSES